MPERARAQPLRRTRRFAAEGLTVRKVVAAILLGASLGLLASVVRVASKSKSRTLREADRSQTITSWQTSQQANLLSDEKYRRELAEQAQQQETARLKNDLQQAQAAATAAQHDRDTAVAEASQAQNHLDQLSSTVQQLVQRNEQAAREAEAAKLEAQEATKQAHKVTTRLKFGVSKGEDRHALIKPNAERDAENPKLAGLLRKVAINQEVLVAICGIDGASADGILTLWGQAVQQAKISNAVVAALGPECQKAAETLGMPAFLAGSEANAGIAVKFQVLTEILQLGYSALLTDLDVVTIQNPFGHLRRDADIEAASDGYSNATAYGQVEREEGDTQSLGEPLAAHLNGLDPGLFFLRPTRASLDLLGLISSRLLAGPTSNPKMIFNEAVLIPSSTQRTSPRAHVRVLDYIDFMNSRLLFSRVRGNPLLEAHLPLMVHLSFHEDKLPRMQAIINRYIHQDMAALAAFP